MQILSAHTASVILVLQMVYCEPRVTAGREPRMPQDLYVRRKTYSASDGRHFALVYEPS